MHKTRGVLIAGNWKMNHGIAETSKFFADFGEALESLSPKAKKDLQGSQLMAAIFPPMLSLVRALFESHELAKTQNIPIAIGAQNVHWEKSGAFTGEISGPQAHESGIRWALTGHSERRQFFGETDETVRKRTESLLEQGFRVILCIGETRSEREAGQTQAVIERQLQGAIPAPGAGAAKYLDGRLIIAYEPVWAIGTGLTATPEQAQEAHATIRALLFSRFGADAAVRTSVLYGGSVTPENVVSLLKGDDVDGALVGGASLKPLGFCKLLEGGAQFT